MQALQHWLNYPVKKFRPVDGKRGDPLRPLYRRNSQAYMLEAASAPAATTNSAASQDSSAVPTTAVPANVTAVEHKVNGVGIKEEPMEVTNGVDIGGGGGNKRIKTEGSHFNSSDPYEFSDDKKDGKVRRNRELSLKTKNVCHCTGSLRGLQCFYRVIHLP